MNLSLNIFLDYMEIQEFIGQRIYKFLNKNKKNDKLNKNDFCEGLNNLYYGNINELINFTFSLADFNNNGKIYKSDMKLVLAYIPKPLNSNMSNYSQQDYIKNSAEEMTVKLDSLKQEVLNKGEEKLNEVEKENALLLKQIEKRDEIIENFKKSYWDDIN